MEGALCRHDLKALLYNFLDECLYIFCTELFVSKHLEVTNLELVEMAGDASAGMSATAAKMPAEMAAGERSADDNVSEAPTGSVWRIRARGAGERLGYFRTHTTVTKSSPCTQRLRMPKTCVRPRSQDTIV